MNDVDEIARAFLFENSFAWNIYTQNYTYDKLFDVVRNFELWLKVVKRANFVSYYGRPEELDETLEEKSLGSIKVYFQKELYAYFRNKFSEFIKEQEESLEEEKEI